MTYIDIVVGEESEEGVEEESEEKSNEGVEKELEKSAEDVNESVEEESGEKSDIIILFNEHKYDINIAAVIMVKNETLRILVTLTSIIGYVGTLIIYDTGSTDDTVDIIVKFCNKYKISLYLKHGVFIDFSTSRNELLSFSDTVENIDFLLLMDCNDELQNGMDLIKFCKQAPKDPAFFIKQSWKSNIYIHYYNIRLLRANNGWRYKGVVHEYICKDNETPIVKIPKVILFQDRTQDDNKSSLRFYKDKELLLNEYNSVNKTTRTVYYLAQTYECIDDKYNACKYYNERLAMKGFYEERYQSAYHIGMIYRELGKPFEEYVGFFLIAFGIMYRAEPLVRIVEYYISKSQWHQVYFYLNEACKIPIPDCGLFVDVELYNYYRWHLMGISAYYVKEYKKGMQACEIAIEKRNNDIDKHNLLFYRNIISNKSDHIKMSLL